MVKKITVISGKGGTGKTSLVGSFAALSAGDSVMVDGDVDAANLSLIMNPEVKEEYDFIASKVAFINREKCTECGLCRDLCRFEAINLQYEVDPVGCEGCSFCFYACPEEAVDMRTQLSGRWFVSGTPYGFLVHARLGIAEENSGKLVTTIRNKGEELAENESKDLLIIDGPPGIGCPVIASLSGVDAALVVTEPTVSGIHDLKRVIELCEHFNVKASICINRFDLDSEQAEAIEDYCERKNLDMIGRIPFNRAFVDSMVKGLPVVKYGPDDLRENIKGIWNNILNSF